MQSMAEDPSFAYCLDLVRGSDPDRFFAALLAPAERRADLIALYAFHHEVARIPELVNEPMLGAIRQQWWREAVEALAVREGDGSIPDHPVVRALAPAMTRGLSAEALMPLIDGRDGDFEEVPFERAEDRDAYGLATGGALMRAAAALLCHPEPPDSKDLALADQAGSLWAQLGLLRSLAYWASRRRLVVPRETLERKGISVEALFGGALSGAAMEALQDVIRDEAAILRMLWGRLAGQTVPPRLRPALCYVRLAPAYMARVERAAATPLATPAAPGTATKLIQILWAASRKRF